MDEPTAEPVGVPPDFIARLEATAGPLPWSPAVVADFLAGLKDEELLPAIDAIVAAHDILVLANPCCTTAVKIALSRPCKDFPRSWSADDRLVFASLDLATREIILRRENERDAALRTAQNRVSNELKRLRGGDRATTPPWAKKETTNEPSEKIHQL